MHRIFVMASARMPMSRNLIPVGVDALNEIMCVIVYLTIIGNTIYKEFQLQLFGSALVATELFRYVSPTNLYSV